MSKSEKRKYTKEFRAEAVKLVLEQGMSLEEAGASLALPKGTLANWVAAARRGDGAAAVPGGRSVAELEAEVTRLRKELANANVEVEILKNRPTRLPVALMNRNLGRVHWLNAGLWP